MVKVRRLLPVSDLTQGGRSRFILEPMGLGTSDIESLTSLFCRIAERHWMLTIPLWNAIAGYKQKVRFARRGARKRYALGSMNGHGLIASTVIELFNREALAVGQLTLLPWRGVIDPMAHGLLRPALAWCPLCWREDEESGDPIYVRLLWAIESVSVCPKHQVELQTICHMCKSSQDPLPRIPKLSVCKSCGADLVQQCDLRRLRVHDPNGKVFWIASTIASLIRHTCATGTDIHSDAFQNVLKTLAARHFNGSMNDLADSCGIVRRMMRQWATGATRPYLTGLLEFSYRTRIPLDVMLLQGVGLTDPESWLKEERPIFVKRFRKLSKERLDEIRQKMKTTINTKNSALRSVKQFAKALGTTYVALQYHFPIEYKLLQAQTRKKYLESVAAHKAERIEKVIAAAQILASKGVYPSDRALKRRCTVVPSDLRRTDVKRKMRLLRLEFLSGGDVANKKGLRQLAKSR